MHTLPLRPPSPPARPVNGASLWRRLVGAAVPARAEAPPLPADWEQLDPDQRVRRLGEW